LNVPTNGPELALPTSDWGPSTSTIHPISDFLTTKLQNLQTTPDMSLTSGGDAISIPSCQPQASPDTSISFTSGEPASIQPMDRDHQLRQPELRAEDIPVPRPPVRSSRLRSSRTRIPARSDGAVKSRWPCAEPSCQETFGTPKEAKRHRNDIHLGRKAICPVCFAEGRRDNIKRHIKNLHSHEKPS